jgi:tRNA A37 threonylcarbamoyladenosine dehydratase
MDDYRSRFGGIGRLYGDAALERFRNAHVGVVGIGGVGCWAVEALARSGVGILTLVDLDELCVSNVNRQLHALDGQIGRPKVEAMADRVRAINPEVRLTARLEFFNESTAAGILSDRYDAIVDAIDHIANKCLLLANCRERGIPVVTTGGAGGRRDPTQIRVADLAQSSGDPFLAEVRRRLRRDHGFPRDPATFGIECVYSPEPVAYPQSDGSVCAEREPGTALRLDCESGYGTAAFVTGAFGFAAAARVLERLAGGAV